MSNKTKTPEQLIAFIKSSGKKNPSDDSIGGNSWSADDWVTQLTIKIPNWKEIVADPCNHALLTSVKPKDGAYRLDEVLVAAGGLELAKKWFYSYSYGSDRHYVTESWLIANTALWFQFDERIKHSLIDNCRRGLIGTMTIEIWLDLSQDMKNKFLTNLFEDVEIIPSKFMKELSRDLHFFHREDFAGYASKTLHLNEMISRISTFNYVCSPAIQMIRYIIEDAQDLVYLKRIDDTIEEYRKSWQTVNAQSRSGVSHLRSTYDPTPNERELIARLLSKMQRAGYSMVALPTIKQSYEIPPLFVSHPELEHPNTHQNIAQDPERRAPEYYNVEELLGCYQPEHETIILYERGISWLGVKGYDSDVLRSVVLIHELAHWTMHKLPKPNIADWSTVLYKSTESDLHEAWAQLLTYWIAEEVGCDFEATFEQLNRNQSQPYHLYKQFPIATYSTSKIMTSLEMLRALTMPATLNDWHEILK